MLSRAGQRLALHGQARKCSGAHDWHRLTDAEQLPSRRPLPEDMPKFPFGAHNPNPGTTLGGRPYAAAADRAQWDKDFRKWFETAGPQTDQSGAPVQREPFHDYELHAKYLEHMKTLTDDEKRRLGVTIDVSRTKPFHEVISNEKTYTIEEPAVHLRRPSSKIPEIHQHDGSVFINNLLAPAWKGVKKVFDPKEPVKNYLKEYREAMAAKQAEAKSIEGETVKA